ncbi:MAG: FAD-dependent oxidoreductase [Bdellovibrionales bacterium]
MRRHSWHRIRYWQLQNGWRRRITKNVDIVIFGAGIAGLWTFNRLKRMGYDVLLLENKAIGCGQTIASQGIIHSGLKYAFAGQINNLAKSISAMPDLWRDALAGNGPVDLSTAKMSASSQHLLIPSGFMGGLVKLVTKKALGGNVHEVSRDDWPNDIKDTGFKGSVIYMDEPVLDIGSVLNALSDPYRDSIRVIDAPDDPIGFCEKYGIKAKKFIFTGAASNHIWATSNAHDKGLKTQARPLLMGFIKNAPFPLYAHCVGQSDKPIATITTHQTKDGSLVWYLGGGVAERAKEADPQDVYDATKAMFKKYMPQIDISSFEWGVLPIDRIEGKSDTQNHLPDTPTIHKAGDHLYCWPTKLTFAPMLSDMVVDWLDIEPSHQNTDFSDLTMAEITETPWDEMQWTKDV